MAEVISMITTTYKERPDVLLVEPERETDHGTSLEAGGFVLDLDTEERFMGLEVIDASQKLGVPAELLAAIEDAEMSIEKGEDHIRVTVVLTTTDGQQIPITSQYQRTVSA